MPIFYTNGSIDCILLDDTLKDLLENIHSSVLKSKEKISPKQIFKYISVFYRVHPNNKYYKCSNKTHVSYKHTYAYIG